MDQHVGQSFSARVTITDPINSSSSFTLERTAHDNSADMLS